MQGAKMSKSFGNIIPLIEGIGQFGADPLRMGILATAELLQDADFSPTLAASMRDRLERFYRFGEEVAKARNPKISKQSLALPDKWMLSRLQEHIQMATEAMDKLAVRKAIHSAMYELDQDVQWYIRRIGGRKENAQRKETVNHVLGQIIDAQVRMLAPVTPHICEELWEKMDGKGFISQAAWPTADPAKVDLKAEESEALVTATLQDTLDIIKATGIKSKKICYYTAAEWKHKAYAFATHKAGAEKKISQGNLMRELLNDPEMKKKAGQLAKFAGQITDEINKMSVEKKQRLNRIGAINEKTILGEARDFFERELNAEVHVYSEEDSRRYDPKNRAQLAKPYRPAIYIE